MEEIVIFINDLSTSPYLSKELDMITYLPGQLTIHYAWVGPNGIGDSFQEKHCLPPRLSIIELWGEVNALFDDLITLDDLILNTQLLNYYLSLDDKEYLKEIDHYYIEMLTKDWYARKTEEDYVNLAIDFQEYGHFLEKYDFPRCMDAYKRERDLLEEVAEKNPNQENKRNVLVAYHDLIQAYEKLGEEFDHEVLKLYLSYYQSRLDYSDQEDYELAHICEKIGILYKRIDTIEDLDEIDTEVQRIQMSIHYHLIERDIFLKLYQESQREEDYYNYAISLRQLGLRYELLGQKEYYLKAYDYFKKVLQIVETFDKHKYRDSLIIAKEHLGNILFLLEDYSQSLLYYQEVYLLEKQDAEVSQSVEDDFSVVVILKKIGKVYERLKDLNQAYQYFMKSYELVSEVALKAPTYTHLAEKGIALMNMGWYYMQENDYPQAFHYFKEDLSLRESLNKQYHNVTSHYSLSLALRHMGYVLEEMNQEEALSYFKQCYDISSHYALKHQREGELHYLAVSQHDYAYCLKKYHYYQEALFHYQQVIDYLDKRIETRSHEYVLNEKEIREEYINLVEILHKNS